MIHFAKTASTDLQTLLDKAKSSDNAAVYRSGLVYEQIKQDFHEKCYLCEDNEVTSINIEHFEPHKGDPDKEYDWHNLFYSCGHCNGIKGSQFWPLLNCTDKNDQVWEAIEIRFIPFPKTRVEVVLTDACIKKTAGKLTLELLKKTLNGEGTTAMQSDQAKKLREKMLRAYHNLTPALHNSDIATIKASIADQQAFAGMLRWRVKQEYPELFAQMINSMYPPDR